MKQKFNTLLQLGMNYIHETIENYIKIYRHV